ncbi:DDE-type integrase/transposase/recombinase, partial [Streptomyces sp. NPDC048496]|uniref:DDE-type integrase/transposase/recombinase n=1 Tax=Streptomyces sp. NPDC048496 TaxID=3365558 RepID=UPI0037223A1A
FTAEGPNRLWVTDPTMIPTGEGPLWLSAIRDAFSRRVVAWETSARADADLALSSLEYALASREVEPGQLIHHADDIGRKQYGDGLRLASGAPLEPIAGEGAGGAYFLCAEEDGRRPVVFASSEGEGGLLANDLADALEIIIGLAWQECLTFSGGGDVEVMQISAQHLERSRDKYNPDIDKEAAHVATALSLCIVPVTDLVIRPQAAASKTEPDYVVTTDDGQAFDPLFGEHSEPCHGG